MAQERVCVPTGPHVSKSQRPVVAYRGQTFTIGAEANAFNTITMSRKRMELLAGVDVPKE